MTTRKRGRAIPIRQGSRNVYADLGYANADDMLVKAQLVAKIAELIRGKDLTQERAARILGLTQPKVSALLRVNSAEFRSASSSTA